MGVDGQLYVFGPQLPVSYLAQALLYVNVLERPHFLA